MAKNWLDKYEYPKAQNGIEGTMGGLTDKGFNYNGAWGGPSMQMGGTLQPPMAGAIQTVPMAQEGKNVSKTCPPGFVNIEGKCFDRASKEYKELYDYGIGYMDKDDVLVSSRMNLPEIVLKPLSSQQFIDDYAEEKWQKYAFDQLGKKYGFPEVKSQLEYKKKYPYNPFSKGRAHYSDNTIYGENVRDYMEELAHHVNRKGQTERWILNDLPAYIMGKDPYEIEGTAEHMAHSITSPKLKKEFEEYRDKYYDEVYRPEWMDDPEIRKSGMQRAWQEYKPTEKKQMGGYVYPTTFVPQAQKGLTFLQPTSSKLPIGYPGGPIPASSEVAMSIGGEGGEPAYLVPSFKYGQPLEDAYKEFLRTGEHLGGPFKTWQEADEWEQNIRHPYVEKGQDIPTPLKTWSKDYPLPTYKMGGSIPGSVGFTYARTQDIPSEGPYAKKTLPSAQDGKRIVADNTRVVKPGVKKTLDEVNKGKSKYKDQLKPGKPFKSKDTRHWQSDSRTKERTGPAVDFLKKASAIGQFVPHPLVSYPSIALNTMIGGADTYLAYKDNDMQNAAINAVGAIPLPGFGAIKALRNTPGLNSRQKASVIKAAAGALGLDIFGTASDLTNNFGKEKQKNGGSMSFYQHGLDWTPRNISKNGSVVKDDMGYWNPDNWGRIVEIDSPNITMKGVNQDLIGVSNTGDVQYMTPGNDYKFKGKKVTEYPVAKNGINQQDEKTVQHLDQLLNFTNKPKAKNGWLDKYK
jgi:hypothetical protein